MYHDLLASYRWNQQHTGHHSMLVWKHGKIRQTTVAPCLLWLLVIPPENLNGQQLTVYNIFTFFQVLLSKFHSHVGRLIIRKASNNICWGEQTAVGHSPLGYWNTEGDLQWPILWLLLIPLPVNLSIAMVHCILYRFLFYYKMCLTVHDTSFTCS